MLDIREVLRRLQLGETDRRIARDLQLSRKTVGKYRLWAQQQGVLGSPLPDVATLQALLRTTLPVTPPPTMPSTVATFHDRVVDLRAAGVECRAIHQILREEHAFPGSYQAVYRYVRRLEPRTPDAWVRVEVDPGSDYGETCPSPKLDPTKNLTKSEAVDAPRATATKRPIEARRTDKCRAESQGRLQSCTDELSDWHGKTRAFSCHRHGPVGIAQQYVHHCYRQTERPST